MSQDRAVTALLRTSTCGSELNDAVGLTVTNKSDIPQAAQVSIKNEQKIETERISLGNIEPNGQIYRRFEVSHNSIVEVEGITRQGHISDTSPSESIPSKPDPHYFKVDLYSGGNKINEAEGVKKIGDTLYELGKNIGFSPITVKDGLSTLFDALIALVPPSGGQPGKVLYHVQPARFVKTVTKIDEFQYPSTISTSTVHITGTSAASLAASVPIYGSLGINSAAENLYEVITPPQSGGLDGCEQP